MGNESIADPIPTPQDLARTYNLYGRDDAWDAVEEYRAVMQASANHPDKKSHALSKIVDLPRSRIRTWVDEDGMPDPVRAIQVAETRGLLIRDRDTPAGAAFAGLLAWIFSGGSIRTEFYDPYFALDRSARERSQAALEALAGVFDLPLRVNDREAGRAIELVPAEDGSVVGRCLATAGAPVGDKSAHSLRLPAWIQTGPKRVQRLFTHVYLANRGVYGGEGEVLQLRESPRPKRFHEELATLFETVAGRGTVTASASHVRADQTATEELTTLLSRDTKQLLEGS
jgi:hypothetical protein